MPTTISLPESLAFYHANRANRAALDIIMGNPEMPGDLAWDEVLAYHEAKLAAEKVRTDYCALLHTIWQRTWGTAIDRLLPASSPFAVDELGDWKPTLKTVWDGAAIYGRADLPRGNTLWAAIEMGDDRTIQAAFLIEDTDGSHTIGNTLPPRDEWQEIDNAHWHRTISTLCIVSERRIDYGALTNATSEALALVVRHLTQLERML